MLTWRLFLTEEVVFVKGKASIDASGSHPTSSSGLQLDFNRVDEQSKQTTTVL